MKRTLLLAAAAAAILAASAGQALAAGTTLCIGGAGSTVTTPDAKGACGKHAVLTTLADQSDVAALQSQVTTLQGQVAALQTTLSKVSYNASGLNGQPTLTISGANLQVNSGLGSTDATPNGVGNVFIGYDEHPGTQTGSNNLILGTHQSFTSFGGIVAGSLNSITGPDASVTAGAGNTASAPDSSVAGGDENKATAENSSVAGGQSNTASGTASSVIGGRNNTASGVENSVFGGDGETLNSTTAGESQVGNTLFSP